MAKKEKSQDYELKAAKKLFDQYLEQAKEEKEIHLSEDTVQIDDLSTTETLDRIYKLVDSITEKIYQTGRPSIELPSRASSNIIWDEENDILLLWTNKHVSTHNITIKPYSPKISQ